MDCEVVKRVHKGFGWRFYFLILFFVSFMFYAVIAKVSLADSVEEENELVNSHPLTAGAEIQPQILQPGQQAELVIHMQLADGYHAYGDRFKIAVIEPKGLALDNIRIEPLKPFYDFTSQKMKEGVETQATLRAVFEIPEYLSAGKISAQFRLTYQACTTKHCLFPKEVPLEVQFQIGYLSATKTQLDQTFSHFSILSSDARPNQPSTLLWELLLVFLSGFLTSLTPCVYPMIPITLAVLGARGAQHTRLQRFKLSTTYVFGIATTFSVLGLTAASTGALFGSLLGHPVAVVGLALFFSLMGLNQLGLFEMGVPAFISSRVQSVNKSHGYPGALLTGMVMGVVAGPCVGPVLFSILAYVARIQDLQYGFVLLFTYAMGMGVLFLALGTFGLRLPKAGPWMFITKFVFGSVMMAVALFYLSPIVSDRVLATLIGAVVVFVPASMFWVHESGGGDHWKVRKKIAVLLAFVFLAVGIQTAFFSNPSKETVQASPKLGSMNWQPLHSLSQLNDFQGKGQPIIIDFFADWCAACKELETKTFIDPSIIRESRKFLLFRFDATQSSRELDELKRRFFIIGLPTIIFLQADGVWRRDLTLTGWENAETFMRRMQKMVP